MEAIVKYKGHILSYFKICCSKIKINMCTAQTPAAYVAYSTYSNITCDPTQHTAILIDYTY